MSKFQANVNVISNVVRRDIVFSWHAFTYKIISIKIHMNISKIENKVIHDVFLYCMDTFSGEYIKVENPSGELREAMTEALQSEL